MSWRPKEGWKERKDEWFRLSAHGQLLDGSVYEGGADAMLEALKKAGTAGTFYINENFEVCSKEGTPIYIPCGVGEVKGTVVFIPDEGAK